MKKLLLGSATLALFAIAIILFQLSCKKQAIAQTGSNYTLPPATTSKLGGIIVGKGLSITSSGILSTDSSTASGTSQTNQNLILTSYLNSDSTLALYDYNGTLLRTIQPSSAIIDFTKYKIREARLSPDGKLIIVSGQSTSVNFGDAVFTMDTYGNNVKKIFTQNAAIRYLDIK